MLKSYLKTAFRNLWNTKLYSLISIVGLAIGFTIFVVGLFYINNEKKVDKGFADYKDIFRIETKHQNGETTLLTTRDVCTAFQQHFPEIESVTQFSETPIL